MSRGTGSQIALVGAAVALGLATNHFFFHWVLFTESLARWILY